MKPSSILFSTDRLDELIGWLMPACQGLRVQRLIGTSEELTLVLASARAEACCPLCGQATTRVHSRDLRTLQDLPWGHLRVRLRLQVQRFFCQNPSCARRTNRLREALLALGWALGGRAGARQCAIHAMPICGATLLSLLRRWGAISAPTPRVLGVDDWSFQARTPGTLLVDLEHHRPVEVLLGSDEQVLADWLLAHPGVQIVSRDRGASYQKALRRVAPHLKQVLDRWHILKNLGEVLQKALAQQMQVLRQAAETPPPVEGESAPPMPARTQSKPRKPPRRKEPTLRPQRVWQLSTFEQVRQLDLSRGGHRLL